METVNNLIAGASNLIYGENNNQNNTTTTDGTHQTGSLVGNETTTSNNVTGGTEPLSGQTGAGTAHHPYDAGNTTGEPTNSAGNSSLPIGGLSSNTANTSSSTGVEPSTGNTLGSSTGNTSSTLGSSTGNTSSTLGSSTGNTSSTFGSSNDNNTSTLGSSTGNTSSTTGGHTSSAGEAIGSTVGSSAPLGSSTENKTSATTGLSSDPGSSLPGVGSSSDAKKSDSLISDNPTSGLSSNTGASQGGISPAAGSSAETSSRSTDGTSGATESASRNPDISTTGTTPSVDSISKGASASAPTDVGSAPPDSGHVGQKQQGADRPNEEPGQEQTDAIKSKQAAADAVQSGSGSDASPKPLSGGGSQEENLGSTSNEPGTGEKYIKSSGTKADGGDFDAANAGAGREADRLLESKGIKREDPNHGSDEPEDKSAGHKHVAAEDGKPSMGQKLKEKLHIGSSSK